MKFWSMKTFTARYKQRSPPAYGKLSKTTSVFTTRVLKYLYPRLMNIQLWGTASVVTVFTRSILYWHRVSFLKYHHVASVVGRICVCCIHSGAWLQYPGKSCLWCEENMSVTYIICLNIIHMRMHVLFMQSHQRCQIQIVTFYHL